MKIFTFSTVYDSNFEEVGLTGYDLARAQRLTKLVLPSFIISSEVFEEFFKGMKNKSYKEIRGLLVKKELDPELIDVLKDSYEALNVDLQGRALFGDDEPTVNLILSPNYYTDNPASRFVLNIKSFDQFIIGLKTCWLKIFEEQEVKLRERYGIQEVTTAVIVQKYFNIDTTFEAYTSEDISFSCYKGLPDVSLKATKDLVTVNNDLQETSYNVGTQEYKLVQGDNPGELLKIYLKGKSVERKAEISDVNEVSRIVKRLKTSFNRDISTILVKTKRGYFISYIESIKDSEVNETVLEYSEEPVKEDVSEETITEEKPKEYEENIVYDFKEQNVEEDELNFQEVEEPEEKKELEDTAEDIDGFRELDSEEVEEPEEFKEELDVFKEEKEEVEESDDFPEQKQEIQLETYEDEKSESDYLEKEYEKHQELGKEYIKDYDELSFEEQYSGEEDDQEDPIASLEKENQEEPKFLDAKEEAEFITEISTKDEDDIFGGSEEDESLFSSVKEDEKNYADELLSLEADVDDKITEMYIDSFGFEPVNIENAILDLDMKHGLECSDDLLSLKRLRERIDSGDSITEEVESVLARAREFLK